MAIAIQQEPTSPGMANSDVLFTVVSTVSSQPQYQFVLDIYESGSSTLIQRIKQQPNPNAKGVFNIGQILSSYIESDNVWKTQKFATSSLANKDFIIKFGEEYGTSLSSSVLLYTGYGPAGNPAVTGSSFYTLTDGLVDPYAAVNWNFNSASYFAMEDASVYNTFNYQHTLTNAPLTQSVNDGDYFTISYYNGNFDSPPSSTQAQDIFWVQVTWYNSAGSSIQTNDFTNITTNGGGPRTADNVYWFDNGAYDSQDASTRLVHIGVGPQNLEDAGISIPATWASYKVVVTGQGDDYLENTDGVWATLRFNKSTGDCAYNGVRFAWKNEFGVWDYYTFTLQSDSVFNIERQSYEQSFVNFSTADNGPIYDKSRRGSRQYYNALKQVKTANSNWLTQAEADWLRELFFSANVYMQEGTEMLPVVISTANVVEKTNPRTQKNFQYQIEFSPANQLRPRE